MIGKYFPSRLPGRLYIDEGGIKIPMKNGLVQYPVVLSKNGDYVFVHVPDLPFGYTQGKDTLDAIRMAQDLIGNLLEDSDDYPAASEPKDIDLDKGERLVYVSVDMSNFKRK